MVKKLLKHEIIAYSRTILPIYIILLGVAVLTRFVQFFESDTISYNIVNTSSIVMLVVASVVCAVMSYFVGITRFYKNLFTNEGYLTLTLPVTTAQHIFTKSIVAVMFNILSVVAIAVSVLVATLGDVANEIIKAVAYLIKLFFKTAEVNGAFYAVEIITVLLISIFSSYLLFYACISVGQLAKKNRVLAAFGAYFAHYIITQIIGTIFVIVFSAFVDTDLYYNIIDYIELHPHTSLHIGICLFGAFYIGVGLIYYAIAHRIMTRKLNIE